MDPRDRADAVLARAQQRRGVVTPDNMESPMDSADTQVIPSSVVAGAEQDPAVTAKVPSSVIERNDERHHLSNATPTVPLATPQAAGAAAPGAAAPHAPAPALAESGRTQPLDTPNVPPDMTFTGAPVQKPAAAQGANQQGPHQQPTQPVQTPGPQDAAAAEQESGSSEPASDGFVPTTKVQATGQSELSRRLEGL
ncbi:hypothetical protein BJF85_13555 [Saccharomonospora sp. CUA-673]|uniref:hypothetical protein n=1 Tax=Saccharomonospora sp. CUA-673 TaxID=1904969 RepID=UPI00095A7C65|nr:hypothetical protein [Saccharomonospora sp. CUA-673]OLT48243.1 hypothetical protein BJF85_13555 [Saccharomonospora sp. CUA-673]